MMRSLAEAVAQQEAREAERQARMQEYEEKHACEHLRKGSATHPRDRQFPRSVMPYGVANGAGTCYDRTKWPYI